MNTLTLLHLSILVHIIGLTLAAGTTLNSYSLNRRFWQLYPADRNKAVDMLEGSAKMPFLIGLGMGLLILSGIGLMALTKGVYGEQIWFRIKFALFILVIVNGIIWRRLGNRQKKLLALSAERNVQDELYKLKARLNLFYGSQLFLFLAIFILGIFKFN
ncbi:MAG TPA: hypothetical protein VL832_28390 [Puia sp.]|jgi:uncharacterized membrane protein SirB2|nr:hypothetical protein [Puia sp.]